MPLVYADKQQAQPGAAHLMQLLALAVDQHIYTKNWHAPSINIGSVAIYLIATGAWLGLTWLH
jgi:hypothetical protein